MATVSYHEAIKLDPMSALPQNGLGNALSDKGDVDGAIACYKEALKLDPEHTSAHNNLAWHLATCPEAKYRDGNEAVKMAKRACELSGWKDGIYLDTLAAAYAEVGEFDKAVEYQKKSLEFPNFVQFDGDGAKKRLALYEQKKPYHEPPPAKK